jgi:ribosomal protein S14
MAMTETGASVAVCDTILDVQAQRRRLEVGRAGTRCGLCGSENVVLVESSAVRRGVQVINPVFRKRARQYQLCRDCGAKHGDA